MRRTIEATTGRSWRATDTERQARYNEWLKQLKSHFSTPGRIFTARELASNGYRLNAHEKRPFYERRLPDGSHEVIYLDDHGREIEYWKDWDKPQKTKTTWVYDSEGFILHEETKHGSGYGYHTTVHYAPSSINTGETSDIKRPHVPEQIVVQHFYGNPQASWGPRRIERGEDGKLEVFDLTDIDPPATDPTL